MPSVFNGAIDAVLWDFGGVFMPSPFPFIVEAGRKRGLDPDHALMIMFGPYGEDTDHPWHRLERGEIPIEQARDEIMAMAAADGVDMDPWDVLGDMAKGAQYTIEPVVRAATEFKAGGLQTAIVTNNLAEFRDGWKSLVDVDAICHEVIDSSEVGMRKPDPRIYHLALERLGGVAPERAVFVDDFQGNVDAAAALGLHAVLMEEDPEPALTRVRELVHG